MTRTKLQALAQSNALANYHARSIAAVLLGVSPVIVCAWIAQSSGDWSLFERSGSITTAIGLLVASRRYVRHSIVELAALRADEDLKSDVADMMGDILTAKLGLALSGFGTVVWGWGIYFGWWSFGYLLPWSFFVLRDACRDHVYLRDRKAAPAISKT